MTTPSPDSATTPDPAPGDTRRSQHNAPDQGHIAYSDYLKGMKQAEGHVVSGIPRLDYLLALLGNLIVFGTGFAPWIVFEWRSGEAGHRIGFATDGVFALIAAGVAVVALIVAARRGAGGGDFEALIALGASIVSVVVTGFTLLYVDAFPIDNIMAGTLGAGWGIITAMITSVLTAIFSFRVRRAASVY